jgi:ribosomal protein S18 acetylase RimI-like enzyme
MVYNLYVDKQYRNRKIGSHLLKLAEDYFKEKKCEFSRLQVFGTNDKAYKLYEKNEYKPRNINMIKKL